ncbi:hypothetical protein HWQ46_06040 [Shewanella sp. D64]|uniref:hypothetical protein n=1 Tax=unclassified Shewanella TaxID=196818 RepID=UPI0022BA4A69|nr:MULTISPECIES: hypothetical protein [unclassified Shewanella]MEC4725113.1 hypothetical protein [Shewanella sp. D64]MEC4737014.1 hypothetical protein [Shewanella sp. E94]WBJ96602.1 hypothetical protein HWQ47_05645 [Shewanella sp. MTB7]
MVLSIVFSLNSVKLYGSKWDEYRGILPFHPTEFNFNELCWMKGGLTESGAAI